MKKAQEKSAQEEHNSSPNGCVEPCPTCRKDRESTSTELTRCDWEEIAAAIYTKREQIDNGDFGEEDEPGADARWIEHLDRILKKIGEDGEIAFARQNAKKKGAAR